MSLALSHCREGHSHPQSALSTRWESFGGDNSLGGQRGWRGRERWEALCLWCESTPLTSGFHFPGWLSLQGRTLSSSRALSTSEERVWIVEVGLLTRGWVVSHPLSGLESVVCFTTSPCSCRSFTLLRVERGQRVKGGVTGR